MVIDFFLHLPTLVFKCICQKRDKRHKFDMFFVCKFSIDITVILLWLYKHFHLFARFWISRSYEESDAAKLASTGSELHNSPLEIYSWRHRDYVSDLANPAALQLYNVTSCVSLLLLSSKTDNSRTKRTGNSRLRSVWSPENNLKCRIMLLIWSVNGKMFAYTSPQKTLLDENVSACSSAPNWTEHIYLM